MYRDKEGMSKHFFLGRNFGVLEECEHFYLGLAEALSVKFEKSHDLETSFKVTSA